MTEAERLERERDWVTARFHCTVHSVFERLTVIIKSDIERYNKLTGKKVFGEIQVSENSVTFGQCADTGSAHIGRVACVSTDGRVIEASKRIGGDNLPGLKIKPEWNDREMDCDLYIGDEKVSIHRASQKIIGDVLFS